MCTAQGVHCFGTPTASQDSTLMSLGAPLPHLSCYQETPLRLCLRSSEGISRKPSGIYIDTDEKVYKLQPYSKYQIIPSLLIKWHSVIFQTLKLAVM